MVLIRPVVQVSRSLNALEVGAQNGGQVIPPQFAQSLSKDIYPISSAQRSPEHFYLAKNQYP